MAFGSKKYKRKGWYGNKSRKHYTKKEYRPNEQLKQADKSWIIINYNQFRQRTFSTLIRESTKIIKGNYRDNREIAQAISHSYVNYHEVFNQLDNLYEYVSRQNNKPLKLDGSFRDLIKIFQSHIWWFSVPEFYKIPDGHFIPWPAGSRWPEFRKKFCRHFIYEGPRYGTSGVTNVNLSRPMEVEGGGSKTVLLAFSGGRGSLATALFYKDHGFDVRLLHVRGINRAYMDELASAKAQAERLELPLYVYNIKVNDGYYEDQYTEHPMRNIVIANTLIHFCLEHNLPHHIAFGTYEMDRLAYNCFDVCGGSCKEMWEAYEKIVRRAIPDIKISTPLSHEGMAVERLLLNPGYFSMTTSCATELQHRYIGRERVKKFFGIKITDTSCGICWKCAKDYIFRCDYNLEENPNYHYYIICLTILKAQFDGERGYPCDSIYDIWNRFFFYNIAKSKFHEDIRQAKIRVTGNISFPNHVVEDYYKFNAFKRVSSII